jgi:ribose/xylose/arabinose/galactoside ABC-type transport system permease subunit
MPWWLSIILMLVICAAMGLGNGLLVTKLRFPAFIATLATASMIKGLMYIISSIGNSSGTASNVNFQNEAIGFIGTYKVGGFMPLSVIILVIFFIVFGILMSRTTFGSKVAMLGSNPVAANLAGINSAQIIIILFMLSAIMGGVSGLFNTARLQQGSLTALATNQFTGLTAAMLGGISFGGGTGGMLGVFIGLLILNTFQIGMSVVGLNVFLVNVFSGVLLLIALTLDFVQRRRAGRL